LAQPATNYFLPARFVLNFRPVFPERKANEEIRVEAIGHSLPAVFKRRARRAGSDLVEVLAPLWARAAGKAVAEHSRPVAFWSGALTLAATSETWAAQLRMLGPEVLGAVNAFLGAPLAKELRVRVERAPEREEQDEPSPMETRPADELRVAPCDLPRGLDAETKTILARSFSKYFARAKRLD
jgi:hypothetical protein